jgi:hypothetical protein
MRKINLFVISLISVIGLSLTSMVFEPVPVGQAQAQQTQTQEAQAQQAQTQEAQTSETQSAETKQTPAQPQQETQAEPQAQETSQPETSELETSQNSDTPKNDISKEDIHKSAAQDLSPSLQVGPDGCGVQTAGVYFTGSGTQTSPYQINTAFQLAQLACLVNQGNSNYNDSSKYYILADNISLKDWGTWTTGDGSASEANWTSIYSGRSNPLALSKAGWIPIGYDYLFSGRVNITKTSVSIIKNLTIYRPNSSECNYAGLFGMIQDFQAYYIGLENVDILGYEAAGALVGITSGNAYIEHSYSTGVVANSVSTTDNSGVGGLVGSALRNNLYISTSYSTALAKGYSKVGGLVGYVSTVVVLNLNMNYTAGYVYAVGAGNRHGGLIGSIDGNSTPNRITITNNYVRGDVSGYLAAGGLIGEFASGTVAFTMKNNYVLNRVKGNGRIGGFIGAFVLSGSVSALTEVSGNFAVNKQVYAQDTSYLGRVLGYFDGPGAAENMLSLALAVSDMIMEFLGEGVAGASTCGILIKNTPVPSRSGSLYNGNITTPPDYSQIALYGYFYTNATVQSQYSSGNGWINTTAREMPILAGVLNVSAQDSSFPDFFIGSSDAFSGSGTSSDPYIIDSAYKLAQLGCLVDKEYDNTKYNNPLSTVYYKLNADIDLQNWGTYASSAINPSGVNWQSLYNGSSDESNYNTYGGWVPIGYGNYDYNTSNFFGNFDGNGKIISNLKINRTVNQINSKDTAAGLFGAFSGRNGSIKALNNKIYNLKVQDVNISSPLGGGGVVGILYDEASVQNIFVSGNISGCPIGQVLCLGLGGAIGKYINAANDAVTVYISEISSTVTLTSSGEARAGGIIGILEKATTRQSIKDYVYVENNYSNANISINSGVAGGIIGHYQIIYPSSISTTNFLFVTKSYSEGSINITNTSKSSASYAGGIIGYLFLTGTTSGTFTTSFTFTQCYTLMSLSSNNSQTTDYLGGILGYLFSESDIVWSGVLFDASGLVALNKAISVKNLASDKYRRIMSSNKPPVFRLAYAWDRLGVQFYEGLCGKDYSSGANNFSGYRSGSNWNGEDLSYETLYNSSALFVGKLGWDNSWNYENGKLPTLKIFSSRAVNIPSYILFYFSGTGMSTNPYIISNAINLAQLACIINNISIYSGEGFNSESTQYKLSNNIDLVNWSTYSATENPVSQSQTNWKSIYGANSAIGQGGWVPIGYDQSATSFKGLFDGNGKIISNLKIDRQTLSSDLPTSFSDFGLFGSVEHSTSTPVIYNIGIQGVSIKSFAGAGGLAGRVTGGIVQDAYVINGQEGLVRGCMSSNFECSTGAKYVGGLIGYVAKMQINRAFANISLVQSAYVAGGLVGFLSSGAQLTDSYSSGEEVKVEDSAQKIYDEKYAGGLIGQIKEVTGTITVQRVYSSSKVIGNSSSGILDLGGLIGYATQSGSGQIEINSGVAFSGILYNKLQTDDNTHRILGALSGASANIELSGNYALENMGTALLTECGKQYLSGGFGGAKGDQELNGADVLAVDFKNSSTNWFSETHTNFDVFTDASWDMTRGATYASVPILKNMAGSPAQISAFQDYIADEALVTEAGSGTSADPYQIASAKQLAELACVINTETLPEKFNSQTNQIYYKLMADIDLSDWQSYSGASASKTSWDSIYDVDNDVYNTAGGWVPIGYGLDTASDVAFFGNFDGNDKTISNLKIDRSNQIDNKITKGGLFGNVSNATLSFKATIKDLNLLNLSIANVAGSGGLVGMTSGQSAISKIYVTGAISHKDSALCSTDDVCNSMGGVIGSSYVAKVADSTVSEYSQLRSDVEITAVSQNLNDSGVGGIIGSVHGYWSGATTKISQSYSRAQINILDTNNDPAASVGGIAGRLFNGQISDSYSEGSLIGNSVGGIAGYSSAVAGQEPYIQITNTYSTATISTSSGAAGGILGIMESKSGAGDGKNSVRNNVALNDFIKADSGSDYHRVIGKTVGNHSIGENWAYSNIGTAQSTVCQKLTNLGDEVFTSRSHNSVDGADAYRSDLRNSTVAWFTRSASNWTAWDSSIWNIDVATRPTLKAFLSVPASFPMVIFTTPFFDKDVSSQSSPYEITTAQDLAILGCIVNADLARYNASSVYYTIKSDVPLDLTDWGTFDPAGTSAARTNWLKIYTLNGDWYGAAAAGGWIPIGINGHPFLANFDGAGKVISNLKISRHGSVYSLLNSNQGLFGTVGNSASGASISKIVLQKADIQSLQGAGAIAGLAENSSINAISSVDSSIAGCYTNICNEAYNISTGGLVGHLKTSNLTNSYSTGAISGKNRVGGLVGSTSEGSSVRYSYFGAPKIDSTSSLSQVSGISAVGGIAGQLQSGSSSSDQVNQVYSVGEILGDDKVAGIVGDVSQSNNTSITSTAALIKSINPKTQGVDFTNAHRILGSSFDSAKTTLSKNFAWQNIAQKQYVLCGGPYAQFLIAGINQQTGNNGESVLIASFASGSAFWKDKVNFDENIWTNQNDYLPVLKNSSGQQNGTIEYLTFYLRTELPFYGSGTSDDPYSIDSARDLAILACFVNSGQTYYNGKNMFYKISDTMPLADLSVWGAWTAGGGSASETNWKSVYSDASEANALQDTQTGWIPIGTKTNPFLGNFDGNGQKISNLAISRKTVLPNTTNAAGLFGYVTGVDDGTDKGGFFENLGLENVSIENSSGAGGLIYLGKNINLSNVYVKGSVKGCFSAVCKALDVYGENAKSVGGVVGTAYGEFLNDKSVITKTYSDAVVLSESDNVGGLVGAASKGNSMISDDMFFNISDSYTKGSVSGTDSVGGVIGNTTTYHLEAVNSIIRVYSTSEIIITGSVDRPYAGGIAGAADQFTITNSAALNPAIKVDSSKTANVHRVIGSLSNFLLSKNYAFAGMGTADLEVCGQHNISGLFSSDKADNKPNGQDISSYQLLSTNFFGTDIGSTWQAWDSAIWTTATGKIAKLASAPDASGQSSDYPQHITNRPYFQGYGNQASPYQISTAEDLAELTCLVRDGITTYNSPDIYYKQTANLELMVYAGTWADPDGNSATISGGWLPIGNINKRFLSNYDGDNYLISNLTINRDNGVTGGLFGLVGDANLARIAIKNIALENVSISSDVAATYTLIGALGAEVVNCDISSTWIKAELDVSTPDSVGGFVGVLTNSQISNSYFNGDILSAGGINTVTGGLAGKASNSVLQNVYFTGSISAVGNTAGIAFNSGSLTISNSAVLAKLIKGGSDRTYRIASGGTLSNNYAWDKLGTSYESLCAGAIIDGQFTTGLTPDGVNGANVSYQELTNSSRNWFARTGDANWTAWASPWIFANGLMAVLPEKPDQEQQAVQDKTPPAYLNVTPFFAGDGADWGTAYQISDALGLAKLGCLVNDSRGLGQIYNTTNTYYKLTADIDLANWGPYIHNETNPSVSEVNWRALYNISLSRSPEKTSSGWQSIGNLINPFKANFDGQGAKISNLSANNVDYATGSTSSIPMGLFGYIQNPNGTEVDIKNINLENINLKNRTFITGGLASYVSSANISNIYITNASKETGGIIGCTTACYSGAISTGGLIGDMTTNSFISNSFTSLRIEGQNYVGGLVGNIRSGNISQSYSTSAIYGQNYVGGLVALATNDSLSIDNSYFTGSVTGSQYVGGIVGIARFTSAALSINETYSAGSVSVTDAGFYAGGILGIADMSQGNPDISITSSVSLNDNITSVTQGNAARIVGYVSGTSGVLSLNNNYAWEQVSVNGSSISSEDPTARTDGVNGLNITTDQVFDAAGFWDSRSTEQDNASFSANTWHMQPNTDSSKWLPVLGGFGAVSSPAPANFNPQVNPVDIGSQDGNAPQYLQNAVNYFDITFKPGTGQGSEALKRVPEGAANFITPASLNFSAPSGSLFTMWCVEGTNCAQNWQPGTQYTISQNTVFVAQYAMNVPTSIQINYSNETIEGLNPSASYFFSQSSLSPAQFKAVCASQENPGFVNNLSTVPLSRYGLPISSGGVAPILYYVMCGSGGSDPSASVELGVPLRQATPGSADYTINNPQFVTQFTTISARTSLQWAESSSASCPSDASAYQNVANGQNISIDKAGYVCLRKPATSSAFHSEPITCQIVNGQSEPPTTVVPYITTIDSKASGSLYVSRTPNAVLQVSGFNLDAQGNKAGQIKIAGIVFPAQGETTAYLSNVRDNGTKADLTIPMSGRLSLDFSQTAGVVVSLTLPSEDYGDSDPFVLTYVAENILNSITPTVSGTQGSPITVFGDRFLFGAVSNVSRVEICANANDCKEASFDVANSTTLNVTSPPYPAGINAKLKIYNLVGEVATNDSISLNYSAPPVNARLDSIQVADFSIVAGTQKEIPVIGLDNLGNNLGDFGQYITDSNSNNGGFLRPGQYGGIATLSAAETPGIYSMSVTVKVKYVIQDGKSVATSCGSTDTSCIAKTDSFTVQIIAPQALQAFVVSEDATILAQSGKTVKLRAFIINTLGKQIEITNVVNWTVSGGGTIVYNLGGYALFTSDGTAGNFSVRASAENYAGSVINVTSTIHAVASTDKYVDNVMIFPARNASTGGDNSAQIEWTNLTDTGVTGYSVKLFNAVDGKFNEVTVPAGSQTHRFDNLFAGGFYATVTPIVNSTPLLDKAARSEPKHNLHLYLTIQPLSFILKDMNTAGPELADGVYWLAMHGIVMGYMCTAKSKPDASCSSQGDKVYMGGKGTSRLHMALFFHRLAGNLPVQGSTLSFKDMNKVVDSSQRVSINWLSSTGVTVGYTCTAKGKPDSTCTKKGDKVYIPHKIVTRGQMALFMYRYAQEPDLSEAEINQLLTKFDDKITGEERKPVAWLIKKGITTGYACSDKGKPFPECKKAGNSVYISSRQVTRTQMATFLGRFARALEVNFDE